MDMIERAARALARVQVGMDVWDGLDPELQADLRREVRAVIEAIREPDHDLGERGMRDAWSVMVDALLHKEVGC